MIFFSFARNFNNINFNIIKFALYNFWICKSNFYTKNTKICFLFCSNSIKVYLCAFYHYKAVEQSLTLECKCHGVSGSCSVRTCWRGLGSSGPAAAGSRLLRRYATAAEVRPRSGGRLPPLYHHDNLLYTTKSPDYCLPDKKRGSLGTVGR